MTKREVLRQLSFGGRIAEEEADTLASYFVETELWRRILNDEIDIVYGAKGSGKSAIYFLLQRRARELAERDVFVVAAENPRGTPVFNDLVVDPPTSELEFQALWKLYLLSLVGRWLQEQAVVSDRGREVIAKLHSEGLLEQGPSLKELLRGVRDYVKRLVDPAAIEAGVKVDPHSGLPSGFTGKITLREPSPIARKGGSISIDELLELANASLGDVNHTLWLLLDRLDVAFVESTELENNALRALFKVYRDFSGYQHVKLKIFLRTDIVGRITRQGFRELSHITRHATITWDDQSLLNLVIRRTLKNAAACEFYGVTEQEVLESFERQNGLFARMFPAQVESGKRKRSTLSWLLSRTQDSRGEPAPRELIHLLSEAKAIQLRRLEIGHEEPPEEALFEGAALRAALDSVSEVRLTQTLYAEYPPMRRYVEAMERQKTQQTVETLSAVWQVSGDTAKAVADQLADLGFFEIREVQGERVYWVPFLYRPALRMSQGAAESED